MVGKALGERCLSFHFLRCEAVSDGQVSVVYMLITDVSSLCNVTSWARGVMTADCAFFCPMAKLPD